MSHNANIDTAEVETFSSFAKQWWDPRGPCAPLHDINPCRFRFIQQYVNLDSKTVLDIGCGAGILSESLAKQKAQVTGIDASFEVIEVAKEHAAAQNLTISYQHIDSQALKLDSTQVFDIVTCMELIEHVPDPNQLIADCYALLKPGGKLFLSTINRTPKAYALAIIGAEYLLKLLPKQTHDYKKFIRPSELANMCRSNKLQTKAIAGIKYNPLSKSAVICDDVDVNYLIYAEKEL